jgi:hypothetical protein
MDMRASEPIPPGMPGLEATRGRQLAAEEIDAALEVDRAVASGLPRSMLRELSIGRGLGGPMNVAFDVVLGDYDPIHLSRDFFLGMALDNPLLGPPLGVMLLMRAEDDIVGGMLLSEPARLLTNPPTWVRPPWPEIQSRVAGCNSSRLGGIAATGAACSSPSPPPAPPLPSPNDGIAD